MSGKARFVFYWENAGDNGEPIPFFTVLKNDRGINNGSTIDGQQLLEQYGIPLPLFPDYKTWKHNVVSKRRCGRCWAVTRCMGDYVHHNEIHHPQFRAHAV